MYLPLPKQKPIWRCPTFLPPSCTFQSHPFLFVMVLSKRPPSNKHLELMSLCSWSGSDHAATEGLRTIEAAHVACHLKQLIYLHLPGSRKKLGWIDEQPYWYVYIYIYNIPFTIELMLMLMSFCRHLLMFLFVLRMKTCDWGFKSTGISNFNIFHGECKVATCCRDLRIFSAKKPTKTKTFSGWWFQPISKISVKMELLPK